MVKKQKKNADTTGTPPKSADPSVAVPPQTDASDGSSPSLEGVSFEDAVGHLEQIVADLESGELGLDRSLSRYERGVQHLKHCYRLLEKAERKIRLLQNLDDDGRAHLEPFEDNESTLESKAPSRSRRRSRPKTADTSSESDGVRNVDDPKGLF